MSALSEFDKAFSLDIRLKTLCRDFDVEFIKAWDQFYELFQEDGHRLSPVGAVKFGSLNDAVNDQRAKKRLSIVSPDITHVNSCHAALQRPIHIVM